MADSKYFAIPFATSGDKTVIPEAATPSGAVSYTQGFGPDYERDPATDPLAKRVPRNETNEVLFEATKAIKYLQLYGMPEWFAVDDSGNPVTYSKNAWVRRTVTGVTTVWVSLVDGNTATPGTDATKWVAISPDILQSRAWNYATAAGTANAVTASVTPAPAALVEGLAVAIKISTTNTGAMTLNLNGLGAKSVLLDAANAVRAGDCAAGVIAFFTYDGTAWQLVPTDASVRNSAANTGGSTVTYTSSGGTFIVPAGVYSLTAELVGAGGGGGYAAAGGAGAGGNGGTTVRGHLAVTPGQSITWSVGGAGAGGTAGTQAQAGGDCVFGTWIAKGGTAPPNVGAVAGSPVAAAAGNVGPEITQGQQAEAGFIITGSQQWGGHGGQSAAGGFGGNGARNGGTAGNGGAAPGGGGGGGSNAGLGGPGGAGQLTIRY